MNENNGEIREVVEEVMRERETSHEAIVAVFEQKLDNLIQAVSEIKEQMNENYEDITDIKLELNDFKNKTEQQQKEIDSLVKVNDANRNWIRGIAATIIGGVILAAVLYFTGLR
jgi:uncharacterized coiled-coil DUF342 family protein